MYYVSAYLFTIFAVVVIVFFIIILIVLLKSTLDEY